MNIQESDEPFNVPKECVLKVFKTTLNEFKTRDKYIRVSVFTKAVGIMLTLLPRTIGGFETGSANRILAKSCSCGRRRR